MKLRTLVRRIRELRKSFVMLTSDRDQMFQEIGFNKAIKDVIKLINQEIKKDLNA